MSFEVDYFTLGSTDATNMFVVLLNTPKDTSNVAMDICGGTAQLLKAGDGDFRVTDSTVRWDSTNEALNGVLASGDKLRIIYDRS